MKLAIKKFDQDYYHEDIGFICEGRGRRRKLKKMLSKARRCDAKDDISERAEHLSATAAPT